MTATTNRELALRPTPRTLAMRGSILWQLWRFVVINLRMTVMIWKSHDTRIEPPRREPAPARSD